MAGLAATLFAASHLWWGADDSYELRLGQAI
jgi:hypothetical protein